MAIVTNHGTLRRIDTDVITDADGNGAIELEAQTTNHDSHMFIVTEAQLVDLILDAKDTLMLFRQQREQRG